MHDFILGAIAIADALVGLVTSQEFVRVLFGAIIIAGFLLAGIAAVVGALTIARIGLTAVARFTTRRARRLERENALLRQRITMLERTGRTLDEDRRLNQWNAYTPRWKGGNA